MPSECCDEYKLIQLYQKSSVWCFAFSHTSTFELISSVATAQPGAWVTVWRSCSQPLLNTIIVAFLWLSIISSDIVFEVEAYKYKAVAQLIKHYLWIAEFTVLWSIAECRNLQPLTRCPLCFIDFPSLFSLPMTKNYADIWSLMG